MLKIEGTLTPIVHRMFFDLSASIAKGIAIEADIVFAKASNKRAEPAAAIACSFFPSETTY